MWTKFDSRPLKMCEKITKINFSFSSHVYSAIQLLGQILDLFRAALLKTHDFHINLWCETFFQLSFYWELYERFRFWSNPDIYSFRSSASCQKILIKSVRFESSYLPTEVMAAEATHIKQSKKNLDVFYKAQRLFEYQKS